MPRPCCWASSPPATTAAAWRPTAARAWCGKAPRRGDVFRAKGPIFVQKNWTFWSKKASRESNFPENSGGWRLSFRWHKKQLRFCWISPDWCGKQHLTKSSWCKLGTSPSANMETQKVRKIFSLGDVQQVMASKSWSTRVGRQNDREPLPSCCSVKPWMKIPAAFHSHDQPLCYSRGRHLVGVDRPVQKGRAIAAERAELWSCRRASVPRRPLLQRWQVVQWWKSKRKKHGPMAFHHVLGGKAPFLARFWQVVTVWSNVTRSEGPLERSVIEAVVERKHELLREFASADLQKVSSRDPESRWWNHSIGCDLFVAIFW